MKEDTSRMSVAVAKANAGEKCRHRILWVGRSKCNKMNRGEREHIMMNKSKGRDMGMDKGHANGGRAGVGKKINVMHRTWAGGMGSRRRVWGRSF